MTAKRKISLLVQRRVGRVNSYREKANCDVWDTPVGETFVSRRQTDVNILGFGCDEVGSFPQDVILEGPLEGQWEVKPCSC